MLRIFKQSNKLIMNALTKTTLILTLFVASMVTAQKQYDVKPFHEVIVSPHISVTFVKGSNESVEVKWIKVDESKFNIEQSKDEIHIYLEDAKTTTKSKKVEYDNYSSNEEIYKGTIAEVVITYNSLNELSLRGEEDFLIEGPIEATEFELDIYGESNVVFNKVDIDEIKTNLFGECILEMKQGHIGYHKITSYGESEIDLLKVSTESAKVVAYGEAEVRLHVSDELKVTSYGEATVAYTGNPEISKGIVIGDVDIHKIRN